MICSGFGQGYLVGNGVADPKFDGNAFVPFAHGMGLISDELFEVCLVSQSMLTLPLSFFLYYLTPKSQNVTKACHGNFYEIEGLECEEQYTKVSDVWIMFLC